MQDICIKWCPVFVVMKVVGINLGGRWLVVEQLHPRKDSFNDEGSTFLCTVEHSSSSPKASSRYLDFGASTITSHYLSPRPVLHIAVLCLSKRHASI